MKHVSIVRTRFSVASMWCAVGATNGNFDAGQSDRQQHYRESDFRYGQL